MTIANRIPIAIKETSSVYTPIKVKNAHKINKIVINIFKPINI